MFGFIINLWVVVWNKFCNKLCKCIDKLELNKGICNVKCFVCDSNCYFWI